MYLNEMERERYRVEVARGAVRYVGEEQPLDTSGGKGDLNQGNGIYIYVCSARTRNIYTFNARSGVMHHSSFLKGEPVLAAGNWQVTYGQVTYVDGLSGHYKPSFENLRIFARACQAFWNPRTVVRPWFEKEKQNHWMLMRNMILLGEQAPLLRADDPLRNALRNVVPTEKPAFRHDVDLNKLARTGPTTVSYGPAKVTSGSTDLGYKN
jgi:hypothetical protein